MRETNRFLSLLVPKSFRFYRCVAGSIAKHENHAQEMKDFGEAYGYFSSHPLIGTVTENPEDILIVSRLLEKIPDFFPENQALFSTWEVVVKALAYRALKKGMEVSLFLLDCDGKARRIVYTVDIVFNLWHQMPAFGLVPRQLGEASPLLLFRGTDLSGTKKGIASVLSDFDFHGVGFSVFQHARSRLEKWLQQVSSHGVKARALGYSLGGNLATYTVLYAHEWLHPAFPSLAFHAPGVRGPAAKLIPATPLITFAMEGDPTSKLGKLKGEVRLLSINQLSRSLGPLEAHTLLVSAANSYQSCSLAT